MPKASAQDDDTGNTPSPAGGSTRQVLLEAAGTAIARSGWGAVTTRQVAALAGVNQGLVHYHFGSMDDLRREAALFVLIREVAGPTTALMASGPLSERVMDCLEAIGRIEPRSDSSLVLQEAMLAATRDEALGALLAGTLEEFRSFLAERIREEGGRHPVEAAAVVTAALDGLLLHRTLDRTLDPVALAAPLLAALELEGRPS